LEGINEESKWYKKRFVDFDEPDKRRLKNTVLRTVLVKQTDPKQDHTSIYHIFERLNTGGTSLQDQEVRNCIYSGQLNTLLTKLNEYQNWRNILGKPKPDSRQKDVQLILRYLSLFHNKHEYKRPMKDFLSKFMDKNTNPSEEFLQSEEQRFKKTCDLIIENLGERPFNPKGALNPSVFDGIFIAFAKNIDSIPSDIKTKVEKLRENTDYKKFTSEATTDPPVVQNRLRLAEEALFR